MLTNNARLCGRCSFWRGAAMVGGYDVVMEFVTVTCPFCFESVEMELDPQTVGELVHDCAVCCNPWRVRVRRRRDGTPRVEVDRAD